MYSSCAIGGHYKILWTNPISEVKVADTDTLRHTQPVVQILELYFTSLNFTGNWFTVENKIKTYNETFNFYINNEM